MDNDFRQISVLPQLAKVLESIQLKLNKGDLKIKDNQHAFTHGRSTVSALASIAQNWFNKTENSRDGRMGVHALFIDFCKAFDLVDHGLLLRKLAKMNVSKSFWLWTRSFLEGRSQQVKLRDALSSIRPCLTGVPHHQHCLMFMWMNSKTAFPIIWISIRTNTQMTALKMK